MTKILLIPAHHKTTSGKRSPDESVLEYAYSRKIIESMIEKLGNLGYDVENPIPETETEMSLSNQCKIINEICDKLDNDCLVLSPHLNAAGSGSSWMSARGWSVFVSLNASQKSKNLAECLASVADEKDVKVRREYSDRGYWVQNLAICRDTKCPAVLTENFFMDNEEDVEFLLSDSGFETVVDINAQGIIKYLEENG